MGNKFRVIGPYLKHYTDIIELCRASGVQIIWITSEYADSAGKCLAFDTNFRSHRNESRKNPCCVQGSPLCEILDELRVLQAPSDVFFIKNYYSCFVHTNLAQYLKVASIEFITTIDI